VSATLDATRSPGRTAGRGTRWRRCAAGNEGEWVRPPAAARAKDAGFYGRWPHHAASLRQRAG